jgi:hypothetical protein
MESIVIKNNVHEIHQNIMNRLREILTSNNIVLDKLDLNDETQQKKEVIGASAK